MKITLVDICNDILNPQTNPELTFELEFELNFKNYRNKKFKVEFFMDCLKSDIYFKAINLSTALVEKKKFEYDYFLDDTLLEISDFIEKEEPNWNQDWQDGKIVEGWGVKKIMEKKEAEETLKEIKLWWEKNSNQILHKILSEKNIYNNLLEESINKLKIK